MNEVTDAGPHVGRNVRVMDHREFAGTVEGVTAAHESAGNV